MSRSNLDNVSNQSLSSFNTSCLNDPYNLLGQACIAYNHYYPNYSYPVYINQESKFDKAFKIIQKLMDKELVKCNKVKDFIKLVGEISDLL